MNGQLDSSPPPHAVTLWLTDHDIIAQLPMKDGGIPYLIKFPLSEGGLLRALELLKQRKHEVLSPLEAQALYEPPKVQPQVKLSPFREKFLADTTQEQRENARKLIEKLGLKR